MKKALKIIVVLFILAGSVFAVRSIISNNIGSKPFEFLSRSDIESVSLKIDPPETKCVLDDKQIEDLVEILQKVIIYKKDNSYKEAAGQAVIFTIIKTDGSETTVTAYGDFIIIDGTGYKTEYEPSEELNVLGNNIGKTRFAQ